MAWKDGQFDVAESMVNKHLKAFSINLNARYVNVNGMTQIKLQKYAIKLLAWLAKKDNLMLLNKFKAFSINLNAQYVNGKTQLKQSRWNLVQVFFLKIA